MVGEPLVTSQLTEGSHVFPPQGGWKGPREGNTEGGRRKEASWVTLDKEGRFILRLTGIVCASEQTTWAPECQALVSSKFKVGNFIPRQTGIACALAYVIAY